MLLRSQIDEMAGSGQSLMPEGIEKDLKPRDLADLIAFLASTGAGTQTRVNQHDPSRPTFDPSPSVLFPADQEPRAAQVRARDHDGGDLRRVKMTVEDRQGRRATGWGETPLSVQWVWPSALSYEERHQALRQLCARDRRGRGSARPDRAGPSRSKSAIDSSTEVLPLLTDEFKSKAWRPSAEPVPWLAALVCSSAFDLALHDAYRCAARRPDVRDL